MVFTTDARMSKAADFFNVPGQELATEEEMKSSGGGGPVEACWWVEEVSAQWRVKGTAWILASDMDGQGIGAEKVKKELGRRMRKVGTEEDAKGWSWGREVTAHFGNLSPGMRGKSSVSYMIVVELQFCFLVLYVLVLGRPLFFNISG